MKTSNTAVDLLIREKGQETENASTVKALLDGVLWVIGATSGALIVTFPLSLPVLYVIALCFV